MSPFYDILEEELAALSWGKEVSKTTQKSPEIKDPLSLSKLPRALCFYFEKSIWLPLQPQVSPLNLLPHFSTICKRGIIRLAAGDARKVLQGAPEEGWLLEENLSACSPQVPDIFSVWYP